MTLQEITIDWFLSDVSELYRSVAYYFDCSADFGDAVHDTFQRIRVGFCDEGKKSGNHIVSGAFVSEESRLKVLADFKKARELVSDVIENSTIITLDSFETGGKPGARLIGKLDAMIGKIESMKRDDA